MLNQSRHYLKSMPNPLPPVTVRYTDLVSYEGRVYTWETRYGHQRFSLVVPLGGGEEISVPTRDLRPLPGPGMVTTFSHAGSP